MGGSKKYIKTVLKDWKKLPGGTWVKRTSAEKKKKQNRDHSNSLKKQLKRRFDDCKDRTRERVNSTPSAGEERIIKFLVENNIKYIREYYNPKLFNPATDKMLYFDFYIPEHHLLIEYDGIHHFKPVYGEEKLKEQKSRDKVKNMWCSKRKWPLLRISCFETDKIEELICTAFDKLDPIVKP